MVHKNQLLQLRNELAKYQAGLVAVSKTKSADDVCEAYESGQKIFGENYVQELSVKQQMLPTGIHWHFIGHLQTNKVKHIISFISLIQSADSVKLIEKINKEAMKSNRTVDCLMQIHIADEETKSGFSFAEAEDFIQSGNANELNNICIKGLMGMATFTDDKEQIRREFKGLSEFYQEVKKMNRSAFPFSILSMGMTSDYRIALDEGSNMVRIGSAIFGERE